jgi:bifunctional non-homologous end joining protein LigD
MKSLPQITPMTLCRQREPFDHPDWIFELKHDGFRCLAYIANGACQLVSRRRNTYKSFAPLRDSLAELRVKNAVLDGEIVYLDAAGRSIFKDMLHRRGEPIFYAFDLLWLNGRDLRSRPLLKRKHRLQRLLDVHRPERVLFAKHIEARGIKFFQAVCESDCEGIIAKRKDGVYSARGRKWIKIKNPSYSQSEGREELFDGMRQRGRSEPPASPSAILPRS